MADLTPFTLSKMFSQLTGRTVSFAASADLPSGAGVLCAEYVTKPEPGAVVARAETAVIASLGGALLGLPKDAVLERLKETSIEEGLRDAMHEVLNVASTPLSFARRVVFQNFYTDPVYLSDAARAVLEKPIRTDRFMVAVEGYTSGLFAVYSDL